MKIEEKLSLDIGSEMQSLFSAAVLQAGLVLAQDAAVVWGRTCGSRQGAGASASSVR